MNQTTTIPTAIRFEAGVHNNKDIIKIIFDYNKELIVRVKTLPHATWSQSLKCWYVPDTAAYRQRFKLDTKIASPAVMDKLSCENTLALARFVKELQLKSYSNSTINTYRNELAQLLQTLGKIPVDNLTPDRLRDYFVWCSTVQKLSENTLHSRLNAVKFYFEQVLHGEKFYWNIPRPKKALLLPSVLSKEQIAALINAITNQKHKTIIMLAYGCGLRVSEVVAVRIREIDGQRKLLMIKGGKGKKDRVVSLSPAILVMLREYYKQYRPADFLFEGRCEKEHLSERSIQLVLQRAKNKSGIKLEGNMHLLRHSFATHLLDKGIDVVFIQKLLGHNDITTTLRYLHVSNKDLVHIISPLDDINGLLKK